MLALAHLKFVIARGWCQSGFFQIGFQSLNPLNQLFFGKVVICLLYTSPSPRDTR